MAVYVPTPGNIVALTDFEGPDDATWTDYRLGPYTRIAPPVDGATSSFVQRVPSFSGAPFGNSLDTTNGAQSYGDPPVNYGNDANDAVVATLQSGGQVDLADRDFIIQFRMPRVLPESRQGPAPDYPTGDEEKYAIIEQCDPDGSNFSFRVTPASPASFNTIQFYASTDGVNVDFVGRGPSRTSGSLATLWTITRKSGWITMFIDDEAGFDWWYPGSIHLGGNLRIGGTGFITQSIDPDYAFDWGRVPLQMEELLIVLDEGFSREEGIGDVPTAPYTPPPASTLTVTQQPANQSVPINADATFTCAFSSTDPPIEYQWSEVGVGEVVGATSASYTFNTAIFADSGRQFYCTATDQSSSLKTVNATLTVIPPSPVIDQQPQPVSNIFGQLDSNSVVSASGTNPLSYQWYWHDDDTPVVMDIYGAQQAARLNFYSTTATDDGRRMYCRVTDTVTMDYLDTTPILITLTYGILGPEDVTAPLGSEVMFTVYTAPGVTTDYYEWLYADDDSEAHPNTGGGNQQITLTLDGTNDGRSIYAKWEGPDGLGAVSRDALLTSTGAPDPGDPTDVERDMLVWNFEDDNFTWGDAGVDTGTVVQGAVCMQYVFEPGWQTPWIDLIAAPAWEDDTNRWIDYFGHGNERDAYWLTRYGLYRSDQFAKTDGVKSYYLRRLNIDMDMLVDKWTTNLFKHLRQFYFHMQSDRFEIDMTPNTFEFATGWSKNLMDSPAWRTPIEVNLQGTVYDGRHKIDLRTTGRYLSMNFDFSKTEQFALTGGDMDAEESHGR